jgi:CRISPR-associated protein Csd1
VILQRLTEYYDRLEADPATAGRVPRPGYSRQRISFCAILNADGTLQQFQSLLADGAKKPVPRTLFVPGEAKPTGSGFNPGFLWDNSAYMLGFRPGDDKPERTRRSFEAFRERHLQAEREVESQAFSAVCAFLRSWSPEFAADHASELTDIVGSFGVFRLTGAQRFVHDDPTVVRYWERQQHPDDSTEAMCLVSGVVARVARLHEPKIKAVRGAQPSGALLVSFNEEAYTSYGKDQSYNAPVSRSAVFKYANALNYLLSQQERCLLLGDSTVVFWAERPNPLEGFVSDLLGDVALPSAKAAVEDTIRAEQVRVFLSQLRAGHARDDALDPDNRTRFFVLALSPNAARLSVRFWIDSTVGELKVRLAQHMADMELAPRPENDRPLFLRRIVLATGRAEVDPQGRLKRYDEDAVSPLLAGAMARAVLTGAPYPQALLSALVNRIRADGAITYVRVAAIKACIARNSRIQGRPKEVPVTLDTSRTAPAYLTGRVFALLEKIQEDSADGQLNATIKDRYFSAASATPGIVFPRLLRLSQHHLAKLETPRKIYFERQLGEAMAKLNGFASRFSLEDQGLFAVGYYHQRQDLFTSKKSAQGVTE